MLPRSLALFGLTAAAFLLAGGCEKGTSPSPPARETGAAPRTATTPPAQIPTSAPAAGSAPAPPAAAADPDPKQVHFAGFVAPKPVTWLWQPPTNRMRSANYVVAAESGDSHADLIVFQGIGGGVDKNIERWVGQFRSPDQGPVEPTRTELTVAGVPVTVVELEGEYMRMGAGSFTPNQRFIAAIIQAPEGDIQITLSGQSETVAANRDAFMAMINGMERE